MNINHLMNETVDVYRMERVGVGNGRFEKQYPCGDDHTTTLALADVEATHLIRIQAASGTEVEYARKQEVSITHVGYAEPDADFQRDDVLKDSGGNIYTVVMILFPSERTVYQKLLLDFRQKGI